MKKNLLALLTLSLVMSSGSAQSPGWLWAKSAGSGLADYGWDIAIDGYGNSYVVGSFQDFITFGSTTLISAGSDDFFIAKYDSSGNVIWAKSAGGNGYEWANSIAIDNNGNSYVIGQFGSNSVTFGNTTLINAGGMDIFIVKYNSSGNMVWAKKAGSAGIISYDVAYDISIDASGNSYLTGSYYGGNISFGSIVLFNSGESDIFIAKYDPSGNVLWAKQAGGSDFEESYGISLDITGNIYITGSFASSISFGSNLLTNVGGIFSDVFVAKYDPSGNVIWAKSAGGTDVESGNAIAVDVSGNSYVTGIFQSSTISFGSTTLTNGVSVDAFVVKYDSSGNVLWAANAGGYDIALDGNGNSYLTGFNTVKYDPAGNLVWASIGGKGGLDIAVDGGGNSYISGSFNDTVSFGSTTLTSVGSEDVFVAKLSSGCIAAPIQPGTIAGNATPCTGSSQIYSVASVMGATSYLWTIPSGWTGTSTINSITVMPGSTGGDISVAAVNACGISPVKTFTVTSILQLPSPVITQTGNSFNTTAAFSSYQWYLNGNLIPGATGQSYVATQVGDYHVAVTDMNNCSGQSNVLSFTVSIDELNNMTGFSFYPNPVNDKLYLKRETLNIGAICLYDHFGRKIIDMNLIQKQTEIDMKFLSAGIYLLKTEEGAVKIVKE